MSGEFDPFANPFQGQDKNDAEAEGKGGDDKPGDPTSGPSDQQAAIDEANRRAEAAEAKVAENQKLYEQKLEEITHTLAGRYDRKVEQQDRPKGPDLTDADFDKAPLDTSRVVAKKEVQEALETVGTYYGGIISNLTDQVFVSQLEALRNERFFEYVRDDIVAFFEKNPEGKRASGAAKTIYQQFVGQRLEELLRREAEDEKKLGREREDLTRQRIVRPNVRDESGPRVPSPRMPASSPETEQELDPHEAEVFQIYRRYGVFEDEEDWKSWKHAVETVPRSEIPANLIEAGRK